jgi:hypothetical protein
MPSYSLNEAKMFSDIADGVAIVINSETGIYYGMNELGTAVFEAIIAGASTENIGAALQTIPNAPNDVQSRVDAFVAALQHFEILIPGQPKQAAPSFEEATAISSNFEMTVQEYNDAQELLLADPIHEVKVEDGWQPDKSVLETDKDIVAAKESKVEH